MLANEFQVASEIFNCRTGVNMLLYKIQTRLALINRFFLLCFYYL